MKTITIGRGPENMVTLSDPKISRRHAILRCYPSGKMEIVDLSQNGTFVNGIRIAGNKPFPVSRKDIIDIAHVEKLEWNAIPNPYRAIKISVISTIACIVIICLSMLAYSIYDKGESSIPAPQESVEGEGAGNSQAKEACPQDTLKTKKKDDKKKKDFFPETKPSKDAKKGNGVKDKKAPEVTPSNQGNGTKRSGEEKKASKGHEKLPL